MITFDKSVMQRLFRYAVTLCMDQDDAYDLLQYAVEKYLKNTNQTHENGLAYVRTIMRNKFIDNYRRLNRFQEERYDDTSDSAIAIDETSLEDMVIAQADLEIIWKHINPFEREILYYWAVEEMTAQEISRQIDIPRGTVLSRIYRLRKKFESGGFFEKLSGGGQA